MQMFCYRRTILYHVELGYSSVPSTTGCHVLFLCLLFLTKTWSVLIFKAARHSNVSPRHTDPYASPPCCCLNVDSLPGEQTEGTVVTVREEAWSSSWHMTWVLYCDIRVLYSKSLAFALCRGFTSYMVEQMKQGASLIPSLADFSYHCSTVLLIWQDPCGKKKKNNNI